MYSKHKLSICVHWCLGGVGGACNICEIFDNTILFSIVTLLIGVIFLKPHDLMFSPFFLPLAGYSIQLYG